MARTTSQPKAKRTHKKLGACLRRLAGGQCNEKDIRLILGDWKLRSLTEVAEAFGIRTSTAKQSWRSNGMPGSSGNYDFASIFLWLVERDAANQAAVKKANPVNERLAAIELERAELALAEHRDRRLEKQGEMISVVQARLELGALCSVVSRVLQDVPQQMMPVWPEKQGELYRTELERLLRFALTRMYDEKIVGQEVGKAFEFLKDLQAEKEMQEDNRNGKPTSNTKAG